MAIVTVKRITNASAYIPNIGTDADEEFRACASLNDADIFAVLSTDVTVGLALAAAGDPSLLYVYIFPPFRRNGFGTAANRQLETMLNPAIQSCCRHDDAFSRHFLSRLGYQPEFTSSFMVYAGADFSITDAPIRPYTASDFATAHQFTAEAFHIMRLASGQFPNSVIEEPDAATESYWKATAHRRFVYEANGQICGMLELGEGTIECVAVAPFCQKHGIGMCLVKFGVNRLMEEGKQTIGLYCVTGNPARHLYEKLGFTEQYRNVYALKK